MDGARAAAARRPPTASTGIGVGTGRRRACSIISGISDIALTHSSAESRLHEPADVQIGPFRSLGRDFGNDPAEAMNQPIIRDITADPRLTMRVAPGPAPAEPGRGEHGQASAPPVTWNQN